MQRIVSVMNPELDTLLRELHAASEKETLARARAQFAGTDDEFRGIAQRYFDLSPQKQSEYLEEQGLSTNDADDRADVDLSLAISPAMGNFLSSIVLAKQADMVLELGSSNGVSTLYFAQALRTLGHGKIVATELNSPKCARLRHNIEKAGLERYVDLREGNVFDVVRELTGTFDVVFIDIWGSAYLDAMKSVDHLLAAGTTIIADNMYTARHEVQPFKNYLASNPRFVTTTMPFEAGVEFAVALI